MSKKNLLLLSTVLLLAATVSGIRRTAARLPTAPGDLRDALGSSAYNELLQNSDSNGSVAIIPAPTASAPANTAVAGTGGKECKFILAWGHNSDVTAFQEANPTDNMVIQGCGIGRSGFNALKEVGLYQTGPNGTWFGKRENEWSNAWFNLFNFADLPWPYAPSDGVEGIEKIYEKNNLLGFMRMTQIHFIGIIKKAMEQVQSGECGKVILEFACPSQLKSEFNTIGTEEFDIRIKKAFKTKLDPAEVSRSREKSLSPEMAKTFNDMLYISSVLNNFADICGKDLVCGSDGTKSFPEECGQKVKVDSSFRLSKDCLNCYEYLKKYRTDSGERKRIINDSFPQTADELYKYLNLAPGTMRGK